MYDCVVAKCSKCNEIVEFQSKSGKCLLISYSPESVPPEIAADINGEIISCLNCDTLLKITIIEPINRVKMHIEIDDM